jgi:hypothetical protein
MDAIALSSARAEASDTLPAAVAATAIALGAIANTATKLALALSLGSSELRRAISIVLGATLGIAGVATWMLI